MIEKDYWLDRIEEFLEELSDEEFQERVWIRGEGDKVSSYAELMCGLFDDFSFDAFLCESWQQFDLSETIHSELLHIQTLLNKFNSNDNMSDEAIVRDPTWKAICNVSSVALKHLRAEREAKSR